MPKVAHPVETFKDLEWWLLSAIAQEYGARMTALLEKLDEELHQEMAGQGWESIGKRSRTLVSVWNVQIHVCRRGYRRMRSDGRMEYRWPLDELLGLPQEERFSPLVQHLAVGLAVQVSFRAAATFLQRYLQVPVSHQQVHRWVQAAGAEREDEEQQAEAAVFEAGQRLPGEERGAAVVAIEADGIHVHLQREKVRGAELKRGVMHEGWAAESPARKRFGLVNKLAWAGFVSEQSFWQRCAVRFYGRYDRRKVGRVVVSGDGAEWIKAGRHYIEGAEVYLDRFHRNEALRQGLGFAPALLQQAHAALRVGDLAALQRVLAEAQRQAPSEEKVQRVTALRRYLEANWEGLRDWRSTAPAAGAGARGLGAAEAQVNHVLAARMSKRGMSWRIPGAHRMALLRCLEAEGRLAAWLQAWVDRRWRQVAVPERLAQRRLAAERLERPDPSEWLRARLPLLATAARKSELGRLLRQMTGEVPAWELRSAAQPAAWGARIVPPRSA